MLKRSLIPLLCMIAVVAAGISSKSGKKRPQGKKDLKLVGGDPVVNDEYSFIASIRIMPRELHRCGGFLISASHVMTTASCIFSARGRELHAYLNPLRLDNLGVYYPVKGVTTHPNFTLSPQENDVAVATLSKTVTLLPKFIPKIPDWVEVPLKIDVLSFGWGYDKADNEMGVGNFTLHRYKLQVMSNGLCSLILREYLRCEVLCAATQGEKFATGPGDVGTPLIYRDRKDGRVYAVGILIKETEDMVNAAPYLKLRNYIDWVNEILNENKVPPTTTTTEIAMETETIPPTTTTTTTTTTESIIITVGTESDEDDYTLEDGRSAETRMNKFGSRRNRNDPSATGGRRQLRSGSKPRNSSY